MVTAQDAKLRELCAAEEDAKKSISWALVAKELGNRHTPAQTMNRWTLKLNPRVNKGMWTPEEDQRIIDLVAQHGAQKWSVIAGQMKGRIGKQCRERWVNHLNPNVNKDPWTEEEDRMILRLQSTKGNKWAEMAKEISGR